MSKFPIKFQGYNIKVNTFRTETPSRVEIDVSDNELDNLIDILTKKLPDGIYDIQIDLSDKEL